MIAIRQGYPPENLRYNVLLLQVSEFLRILVDIFKTELEVLIFRRLTN